MNRFTVFVSVTLLFCIMLSASAQEGVTISHAFALRGTPKYKEGFKHFDYVNPDAPKGGTIVYHAIGTFDNFNRYAQRGVSAAGSDSLYDTLMVGSGDEVDVVYGLVAEKIEYPADFTWVIFHIDPAARFHDGKAITAGDVKFSFNKFMTEGVPQFKQYYKPVNDVAVLDTLRVKFTLERGDKKMIQSLSGLTILPEHYWKNKDFSEPSIDVPVGSGPYTYGDYKIGQYVIQERVKDYWAKDHPAVKGHFNFDTIRYDYYRDQNVAFEAFKAGEYDFFQESIAKNWATMYDGSQFEEGKIIKEEIEHEIPQGVQAFVFNLKHPLFEDIRVRKAVSLMFDFEWMNKYLFFGQYKRTRSFFQNTEYEADALPTADELEILENYREKIPDSVFTEVYQPTVTDGSGYNRTQIREAIRLLNEAGWELKKTKMVNKESGKQMSFEFLTYSPSMERIAIPFQRNLKRIGIDMKIRTVDTTQFINRMRNRDFELITYTYSTGFYPSDDLYFYFHSDFIDSTYNAAGVDDPVINSLIVQIAQAQYEKDQLLLLGKAFDRIMTHSHICIPQWYLNKFRIAYWNKFSRPQLRPKYGLGLSTWWYDDSKAEALLKEDK